MLNGHCEIGMPTQLSEGTKGGGFPQDCGNFADGLFAALLIKLRNPHKDLAH